MTAKRGLRSQRSAKVVKHMPKGFQRFSIPHCSATEEDGCVCLPQVFDRHEHGQCAFRMAWGERERDGRVSQRHLLSICGDYVPCRPWSVRALAGQG